MIVILLLVLSSTLSATAIIVSRTPDRVVLAADSALRHRTADVTRDDLNLCKMRRAGRWHVVSGAAWMPGWSESFAEAIATVERQADLPAAVVAWIRAYAMPAWPTHEATWGGGPYGWWAVGGAEDGAAVLSVFQLRREGASWKFDVADGQQATMTAFSVPGGPVASLPSDRAVTAAEARQALVAEAALTEAVRPPFDILEITPSGAVWSSDSDSLCVGASL